MRHNSVFASTMLQHYSRPISINDRDNTDCSIQSDCGTARW